MQGPYEVSEDASEMSGGETYCTRREGMGRVRGTGGRDGDGAGDDSEEKGELHCGCGGRCREEGC